MSPNLDDIRKRRESVRNERGANACYCACEDVDALLAETVRLQDEVAKGQHFKAECSRAREDRDRLREVLEDHKIDPDARPHPACSACGNRKALVLWCLSSDWLKPSPPEGHPDGAWVCDYCLTQREREAKASIARLSLVPPVEPKRSG